MAKLMLVGKVAYIELKRGEDVVTATCRAHTGEPRCTWVGRYDNLNDATEYAQDHADWGIGE